MSFRSLHRVLHNVRRAAILSGAVPRTDAELLEAFVAERDAACFDALVHRYGPLVIGICRRVLRHAQDAEDAFQATFLLLIRRAHSLRRREAVGNWLYGVAYRTALQARDRAARRRLKEADVQPLAAEESAVDTVARLELQALVDRALHKLPAKYRAPIVLCELMGKTKKQAAEELGCPEGTVSSRLARGLELLRKRLGQRGSALAGGVGAILLEQTAVQAVPLSLYGSTLTAAVLVVNGNFTVAGGLTPNVAALMHGALKSMLLSKLKIAAVLVLAMALVGAAATVVVGRSGPGKAPRPASPSTPALKVVRVERPNPDAGDVAGGQQSKKEHLLYGGKDFAAWNETLHIDLKPEVRMEAIKALGAFGVNGYADEATAAILEVMNKYDAVQGDSEDLKVIDMGQLTLARIGLKALPALAKELDSKNVNARRLAAKTLMRMNGRFSKEALPLFLHAVQDEDEVVRNSALQATVPFYSGSGRQPPTFTRAEKKRLAEVLITTLDDRDLGVKKLAVQALSWLGPDAKSAVPALLKQLEDLSPDLKEFMNKSPKKKAAAPSKTAKGGAAFGGFDDQFGQKGTKKGGKAGKGAKGGKGVGGPGGFGGINFPGEVGGFGQFKTKGLTLRIEIIGTLGSIGPDANDAVPLLLTLLKYDGNLSVRRDAAITLGKIGPAAKEAVPSLIAEFNAMQFASDAAVALGKIGPAAKEAVPALLRFVQSEDTRGGFEPLRQAVIALGNIGPDAKEAVPRLLEIEDARSFAGLQTSQLVQIHAAATAALQKIQR